MENRKRFGFRDDDELIAVIVVLLLVALLAFYFIRGFGQQDAAVDDTPEPIAVVDNTVDGDADNEVTVATDVGDVDGSLNADVSAEIDTPSIIAPSVEANAEADANINAPTGRTATITPTLAIENKFAFGPVLINGQGEPDTDVLVEIDGEPMGITAVDGDGNWAYLLPLGRLSSGDHSVVASSGELSSDAQVFTLGSPDSPALSANYDNVVIAYNDDPNDPKKNQYEITGRAAPNWWVGIGVAGADPVQIPTDDQGEWRATIDLNLSEGETIDIDSPRTYELEVFAVNADLTVNPNISTGPNRIIVTADGQPPAVAAVEETPAEDPSAPASEDDTAAEVDAEATAAAQAAVDAAAAAQAEAQAAADAEAATAEATAQAEAEAQAASEQAAADAAATAEAEAAAQAEAEAQAAAAAEAQQTTVYQQLQATGQHSTLVAAVDAAGLTDTLNDPNQELTLFAPTDSAFSNLPDGVVDTYLGNPEALQNLLTQHVVAGTVLAEGVISAENTGITNLAGKTLAVSLQNDNVLIDDSNVTQADIEASNGVVHAIDQLLLPPSNYMKPVIDAEGVPIFRGNFLTVVGSAQPNSVLILTLNGIQFGSQTVGDDGRFQVSGDVNDGEYVIKAYSLEPAGPLQSISNPVTLIVDNS